MGRKYLLSHVSATSQIFLLPHLFLAHNIVKTRDFLPYLILNVVLDMVRKMSQTSNRVWTIKQKKLMLIVLRFFSNFFKI